MDSRKVALNVEKAVQLLGMLLSIMPELLTWPGLIAKIASSWGMTEEQLRARLAEQEAGLPAIIARWEAYEAQRNPGDTGA